MTGIVALLTLFICFYRRLTSTAATTTATTATPRRDRNKVMFGMTSPFSFRFTDELRNLFVGAEYPRTHNVFSTSYTMMDFWEFSETVLLDGLYGGNEWYDDDDGQVKNVSHKGYIMYENKLLGVPRLRQLRVRSDSCEVQDAFTEQIPDCFSNWNDNAEDKTAYGLVSGCNETIGIYDCAHCDCSLLVHTSESAWIYSAPSELGAQSHKGAISTYSGGGYVQNMRATKEGSKAIIEELFANLWVDRGTRVIFIDFTVYNANINLFCVVKLVMEMPATGGVIPAWTFLPVKLIRYVSFADYCILVLELVFAAFCFYYCVEEYLEIKKHKIAYFKVFWNILDLIVLTASIFCLMFSCYSFVTVGVTLHALIGNDTATETSEMFPDFQWIAESQSYFSYLQSFNIFFAMAKVFKYVTFNATMSQLSLTLAACAPELLGFAVMFFIIFLAFAQLGYLIFGTQIRDFSTVGDAVFTLFRTILGDFNYDELEMSSAILGPMFFLLYIFIVFFILLNMFLAIINDTYSEVKDETANVVVAYSLGDYMKELYARLLRAVGSGQVPDIREALQRTRDMTGDGRLDHDECRQQLKMRGYAALEIEAIFNKYDVDGDRVLDDAEQGKMRQDLERWQMGKTEETDDLAGEPMKLSEEEMFLGPDPDLITGVAYKELVMLRRRVDCMELNIGGMVKKIDSVLTKLEAIERAKATRHENMNKLIEAIIEGDDTEASKRLKMEVLVREEMGKWEQGSSSRGSSAQQPSRSASGDQ